jgi:hypothetical protein
MSDIDLTDRPQRSHRDPYDPDGEPRTLSGKILIVLLGIVVMGLFAMWFYVFSGLARHAHVDTLDSDVFPIAAEAKCVTAAADFGELTELRRIETPAGRADEIDKGVAIYQVLVDDLRDIAPATGTRDGDLIAQWFDDWDIHLADRTAYGELLRGPDARTTTPFTEKEVAGRRVSDRLNRFAEVNFMETCRRPDDL